MNKTINVANICLLDNNNNMLLLKRSKNLNKAGFWGFPGGIVDSGEDSQTAAIRELREETGIQEKNIEFLKSQKFLITKPEENIEITVYLARILNNDIKINLDPFEHTDYKLVNVNDLETRNLMPGIPTILGNLLELSEVADHTIIKPNKIQAVDY